MQEASRKRSRWDPGPTTSRLKSSDDHEAIESLLATAASHSEAKHRNNNDNNNDHNHLQRRNVGSRSNRPTSSQDYYGEKVNATEKSPNDESQRKDKVKPSFALSGALAKDEKTGNVYNGVVLKFVEPPEARAPNTRWRLYVFKKNTNSNKDDAQLIETLHISKQSAYLFGREKKVADIFTEHSSLSKQHAVLQYRALPDKKDPEQKVKCKPYLMDLGSTNGTFINGERLEEARYYELRKGDVITLGASTREYILLTENSTHL